MNVIMYATQKKQKRKEHLDIEMNWQPQQPFN